MRVEHPSLAEIYTQARERLIADAVAVPPAATPDHLLLAYVSLSQRIAAEHRIEQRGLCAADLHGGTRRALDAMTRARALGEQRASIHAEIVRRMTPEEGSR